MNKEETIYVIECQSETGAWEINGPAFRDSDAASRHISILTIEVLAKGLHRHDFADELELDLEKDSEFLSDQEPKTLSKIVDLLEQRGKVDLIGEAADKLQSGGFFSYECVGLVEEESK